MSDALYPSLAGLTYDTVKAPRFNTGVQIAVDLSELRATFASTPVYDFTLAYDLLRDSISHQELKSLAGFYMARFGAWDSFLFQDPDDSVALGQAFGTGDGVTEDFQLIRSFGDWNEPTKNIGSADIYVDAVLQTPTTDYTRSSTGLISFTSAPAANTSLTWDGVYYFRCRFTNDTTEFNQFMRQLWEAKVVQFVGTLGTKI